MKRIDASTDDHGAWVPRARCERPPTADGPLSGLRFAVKDLIDIEGAVTGCGNPDWAASHPPAHRDAAVIATLRAAGAAVAGKTVTDEFAFSLEGENAHFGTPRNPRAPDRLPGGSSSGSAVAVAADLVDFALGTDTGGSVRVPASFCGICGFRPTHGAVSLDGVMPFAPSYDTVGWFARDIHLLRRIGEVLLPSAPRSERLELHLVADAFALADTAVATRLRAVAASWAAGPEWAVFDGNPVAWLSAYATLQGDEIRRVLVPEMRERRPRLGTDIAARFAGLDAITDEAVHTTTAWRREQASRLIDRLAGTHVLVVPTAPGPALLRSAGQAERAAFYTASLSINAIAGHAGLPQVTFPVTLHDRAPDGTGPALPIGLSLIGPPGSDLALLELAAALAPSGPGFDPPAAL